jgi:mRNA interferase RelE/StbE
VNATWRILLTPTARTHLQAITDMRVRKAIANRIDELKQDPETRGKPLFEELAGYYSIRAVGQRYRIIYQIEHRTIVVHIVALGIRKEGDKHDVYLLAKRLFRQGLLDPNEIDDEGKSNGSA